MTAGKFTIDPRFPFDYDGKPRYAPEKPWIDEIASHGTKYLNAYRIAHTPKQFTAALKMGDALSDLVIARKYGERTE